MNKGKDNLCLWIAAFVFALFLLNIFVGKITTTFATTPILLFGDLGEFLLLFVSVMVFIIGVLLREAKKTR